MFAKIMEHFMLQMFGTCSIVNITFDLWMLPGGFDTFALVLNFINDFWIVFHVTIGLFEVANIIGVALAYIVKPLLVEF
jgi:hypothetical protein